MRILRILPLLAITLCVITAFPTQTRAQDDFGFQISKITVLISEVESLGLHHGTANSLLKKLESAKKSYEQGNEHAAMNKIDAFINQVEAKSGKIIPASVADMLISSADGVPDAFDPATDPLVIAYYNGITTATNSRAIGLIIVHFANDCQDHPYGIEIMLYAREMSLSLWYQEVSGSQDWFLYWVTSKLDPSLYW